MTTRRNPTARAYLKRRKSAPSAASVLATVRRLIRAQQPKPSERFIALCAGAAGRGSVVYALDGLGQVWKLNYTTETWSQVGMTRVAKGTMAPPAAGTAASCP